MKVTVILMAQIGKEYQSETGLLPGRQLTANAEVTIWRMR